MGHLSRKPSMRAGGRGQRQGAGDREQGSGDRGQESGSASLPRGNVWRTGNVRATVDIAARIDHSEGMALRSWSLFFTALLAGCGLGSAPTRQVETPGGPPGVPGPEYIS